jgi:hypothetical protein
MLVFDCKTTSLAVPHHQREPGDSDDRAAVRLLARRGDAVPRFLLDAGVRPGRPTPQPATPRLAHRHPETNGQRKQDTLPSPRVCGNPGCTELVPAQQRWCDEHDDTWRQHRQHTDDKTPGQRPGSAGAPLPSRAHTGYPAHFGGYGFPDFGPHACLGASEEGCHLSRTTITEVQMALFEPKIPAGAKYVPNGTGSAPVISGPSPAVSRHPGRIGQGGHPTRRRLGSRTPRQGPPRR